MYNYNYPDDYLMHYGVKGMKWGVRRSNNKSSSTSGQKIKKAVTKRIEKSREKAEKRKKSYERTTDWFGVGGAAIRSYSDYKSKKAIKGFLANVINSSANAYISNNSSKYHISRGVDFARRAAVGGLSLSAHMDQIQAYADVARAYMYQVDKHNNG